VNTFKGQTVWIVGASSGIGAAMAHQLAQQGARLVLSARRAEALEALQQSLPQEEGSSHAVVALDVGDVTAVKEAVTRIEQEVGQLDSVIFMAAIYQPTGITQMDLHFTDQMLRVNLLGAMAVSQAVLPMLKRSPNGQLALCASVAGYMGLAHGQPYSASKAGMINFAQSLYAEVGDQIDVKLINPGFVRTPMTDKNSFDMPFCIEPEAAAEAIVKGLLKKRFEIHFPKVFTFSLKVLSALPYVLQLPILKRFRP
jgi:short-subunit dehydrogenase